MLVDLNRAAHHSAVVVETGVPVRVGQDDIRSAVGSALVGRVEKASQKRANLQDIEVIPADDIRPGPGRMSGDVESDRRDTERREAVEAPVPIAEIKIVGIRLKGGLVLAAFERVQALRLRQIQRVDDNDVEDRKDERVGADGPPAS